MSCPLALALAASLLAGPAPPGAESTPPASVRFDAAAADPAAVPDFQRHVLPLMGRAGCNTRSCHGSFQGQGGLRLSLFGYDFAADRDTLLKADSGRVVGDNPEASRILTKPTLAEPHKGGKRLEPDTWQYRLLVRWIEGGAKGVGAEPARFDRLEVTPGEVAFGRPDEKVPLKVVARWADGTTEDVTCLSRFRTNDESIAEVDAAGVVTSRGAGDTHVIAFYDNGVAAVPVLRPVADAVGDRYPAVATPTRVDELVVAKLRKLGIAPAPTCTDAEFLRRVGFDLAGTAPTPAEVEAFLADPAPDKRARKVDELLDRPTYAAWWTTKLCDYTGAAPQSLNARQWGDLAPRQWYEWINRRVALNTPYDEIVAGLVLASSREEGQSYEDFVRQQAALHKQPPEPGFDFADRATMPHYWARTNFRKPEDRVIGLSYAFLGVRLECAQCHKHPFDQWTQADFAGFGNFFNVVGVGIAPEDRAASRKLAEELGLDKLVGNDRNRRIADLRKEGKDVPWQEIFVSKDNRPARVAKVKPADGAKAGRVVSARVLGGEAVSIAGSTDPRALLMDWLRGPTNPYFARAFVNRVWANDFGAGIVDPPDDMNLANPPSNAPLLDHLAAGFVAHGFDMKWVHREIMTSQTYQRSWRAEATAAGDERNFGRARIRRLPAEVLIDAIAQATAGTPTLAAVARDVETRAIGPRPAAGRGRNVGSYAGKVFGASTRETNCDCNRSDEPNLLQAIYLQNDDEIFRTIDRAGGWLAERARAAKAGARADRGALVREAYLRALGRPPLPAEAAAATDHLAAAPDDARGLRDLLWALLNTKEFATNH